MNVQNESDRCTHSARRPKMTTLRRPFIVGSLVAGVIALGALPAMAGGLLDGSSTGPATPPATSIGMMSGTTALDIMLDRSNTMMSAASVAAMHGTNAGASMMSGTSVAAMHGTSAGARMMSGTSVAAMHGTSAGASKGMMGSTGALPGEHSGAGTGMMGR